MQYTTIANRAEVERPSYDKLVDTFRILPLGDKLTRQAVENGAELRRANANLDHTFAIACGLPGLSYCLDR